MGVFWAWSYFSFTLWFRAIAALYTGIMQTKGIKWHKVLRFGVNMGSVVIAGSFQQTLQYIEGEFV